MSPVGIHLILDGWQVPPHLLNDAGHIRRALQRAVAAGGATFVELTVHQFQPQGLTATATLAQSHLMIHTWPEWGYFAADFFSADAGMRMRPARCCSRNCRRRSIAGKNSPAGRAS